MWYALRFYIKSLPGNLFPPASYSRVMLFYLFPFLLKRYGFSKARVSRSTHALKHAGFPEASRRTADQDNATAHGKRILFVDDRVPDPSQGAGYPRSYALVNVLLEAGYHVTIFPTRVPSIDHVIQEKLRNNGAHIVPPRPLSNLLFSRFLRKNKIPYDIVIISRPDNMKFLGAITKTIFPSARLIYDAEAIFCLRDLVEIELATGRQVSGRKRRRLLAKELSYARPADTVYAVSNAEKAFFNDQGMNTTIVSHSVIPAFTKKVYENRNGILFVGKIAPGSANEDSLNYFIGQIFPLILKSLETELIIVGDCASKTISRFASRAIRITGRVDSLTDYYENCLIAIAPTRIAAGIPIKVHEAAGHALPMVVTPLIQNQVHWEHNHALLVGETALVFAEQCVRLMSDKPLWTFIRENAFANVCRDHSPENFKNAILASIEQRPLECFRE